MDIFFIFLETSKFDASKKTTKKYFQKKKGILHNFLLKKQKTLIIGHQDLEKKFTTKITSSLVISSTFFMNFTTSYKLFRGGRSTIFSILSFNFQSSLAKFSISVLSLSIIFLDYHFLIDSCLR